MGIELSPKKHLHSPRLGYALAASSYERWHWFQFWRENEASIVLRWANAIPRGLVLDAGSGTGAYRSDLEATGHQVVAVDLSFEMLSIQLAKSPAASVVQADISSLPLGASTCDHVLCTRVLSHIAVLAPVFAEFARVARPRGSLLITDVHPEHHYSEMSIPVNDETISIAAFKHPLAEVHRAIQLSGLELLDLQELYLRDMPWKPPTKNFHNVYAYPERPISYVASLRRP